MTKVEIIYDKNLIAGFRMEGHAEFNKGGPDILCSALSATSQMTMNGVLDWTGLDVEELVIEEKRREAILEFRVPSPFYWSATVQHLFKSFETYIELLQEQYKDNIQLERRYEDDNKDN